MSQIFDKKRKRKDEEGNTYWDLIGTVWRPREGTPIKEFITVDEQTAMRPDRISFLAYGIIGYADLILKFNAISNPFSINVGDIILLPDIEFVLKTVNQVQEIVFKQQRNRIPAATSNKLPKKDNNRIERLRQLASKYKNATKEVRSPNRLAPGDSNIDRRDGLLFFS